MIPNRKKVGKEVPDHQGTKSWQIILKINQINARIPRSPNSKRVAKEVLDQQVKVWFSYAFFSVAVHMFLNGNGCLKRGSNNY